MKNSGKLTALCTNHEPSEWEEFPSFTWTSPSSPPYTETPSKNPFSSPNRRASNHSSPSTQSEFEFDPFFNAEIGDEPPVSPKFASSQAAAYWTAAAWGSSTQISSLHSSVAIDDAATSAIAPDSSTAATPAIHSRKQPSIPSPSSVRQLITQEMSGPADDQHYNSDSHAEFYSVPQSPARSRPSQPVTPKHRNLSLNYEPSLHLHHSETVASASIDVRRKSKSAVLDRGTEVVLNPELAALSTTTSKGKAAQLIPSKSELHGHLSTGLAAANSTWEKSTEEGKSNEGAKKPGSSRSFRKWVFKDLLRRTVPSSKADAHYITKTLGAPASSAHNKPTLFSSAGILASPQTSPPRAPNPTSSSTHDRRPPSSTHPHRSPPHRQSSALGRSTARRSSHSRSEPPTPQYPSTPNRTPAPSPPRSPLSPHAVHYKLQKAQSQELGRKTFLPYRQSLLGCLGGSSAFSSDQLVW